MRARSLDRFSRLVRYIAVDLHFDCLAVLSPLTTAVLMREMSTGKDIAYAVIGYQVVGQGVEWRGKGFKFCSRKCNSFFRLWSLCNNSFPYFVEQIYP